jgi:hypothetical protein
MKRIYFSVLLTFVISSKLLSAPGDTTWVTTFDQEFQNWADVHYHNYVLPDTGTTHWQQILLKYTIGCPAGGCDPWDRIGWINLYQDTSANSLYTEIARIITPYNIVGGGLPGTCTFTIDVTDYMPLLHDTVRLGSYIESWIGGTRGWLVTAKFAFIEGEVYYKPYKVININQNHNVVYGDTANPVQTQLPTKVVYIDPSAAMVKARVTTTGHGQGNTDNACEFSVKYHSFTINNDSVTHNLWRGDCSINPCSPQGGTWQYPRAGWCPGADVRPWQVDITSFVPVGQNSTFGYRLEPYVNFCRPNNPNCVNGVTCADCNYNSTGHTEPHWTIESQVILYRLNPVIGITPHGNNIPSSFKLDQNYPNPFNPSTSISYTLERYSHIKIAVYDVSGKVVKLLVDKDMTSGKYDVTFDASDYPSGVYFYKMEAKDFSETKKMVLIK